MVGRAEGVPLYQAGFSILVTEGEPIANNLIQSKGDDRVSHGMLGFLAPN